MYLPAAHAELRIPILRQFLKDNPFGILTTAIPSSFHSLLQSTHLPWVFDFDASDETQLPKLRGHIARQNPQSKAIIEQVGNDPRPWPTKDSASHRLQQEVLVMFNGPVHHYVTPKFYTETKPTTGKAVPTWNYSAVQAYGMATVFVDSKAESTQAFLERQLDDLSFMSESEIMGYERPWTNAEAPTSYTDQLRKNIIGIEIEVTKLEGRFKMSQEKPKGDREGVVKGFEALGTEDGNRMAKEVEMRCQEHDELKAKKQ